MTRRGTLAYYLAAWVIGCFVVSTLQWTGAALAGYFEPASNLLIRYFFTLVFGAIAVLLFSFLLRRLMRLLGTHAPWAWFVSGAMMALALIFALLRAQGALLSIRGNELGEILFGAILKAADVFAGRNIWQAPADGALTALVLCLVDRAFTRTNGATEPKHMPA